MKLDRLKNATANLAETSSATQTVAARTLFSSLIVAVFCLCPMLAFGQTTTFTYQGRFTDSTVLQPTNGTYEMQFKAFDAVANGNQFAAPLTNANVQVVNGVFTVQLDFGAGTFHGADVFLEIGVRPVGNPNPYTLLTPRQQVTSTPYAIQSLNSVNAQTANDATNLGGTAANQYVKTSDARMTDPRNPLPGSFSYIQNTNSTQPLASFNVGGNGTVGATLSGNLVNSATQYNIGGNRILSIGGTNNTFAGINAGAANSTGTESSFFGQNAGAANSTAGFNTFLGAFSGGKNLDGENNTYVGTNAGGSSISGSQNAYFGSDAGAFSTGADNSFVGTFAGHSNTTGNNNTLVGESTNVSVGNLSYATAIGSQAVVSTSNTVMLGRVADTVIAPNLLQINSLGAAGSTSLCRNASNQISTCSSSLRYKTNIAPYARGFEIIRRLKPITFDWKADGMHDVGFGAEDVAQVDPLLVTYNKAGVVEGVKYDRISVALVNAVKEQQEQIQQQQQQIANLKKLVCRSHPRAAVCK